jgi:predicted tellurium resistance membrane protein TerC
MFAWLTSPEAWIALGTLTALEIVLGIDNIIFISILVSRLPAKKRNFSRNMGLILAMFTRLALLFSIVWVIGLTAPWFSIFGQEISGRDIILIGGGLFLLAKATHEIHGSLEGDQEETPKLISSSVIAVLFQIAILDIVFSLDSVITAVGLAQDISIMAIAIICAVGVMLFAAKPISKFVDAHPTIKILALSFLILVGVSLISEGFDVHVPKAYIYFSMAFSVAVEMLNLRLRNKQMKPVKLHKKSFSSEGLPS